MKIPKILIFNFFTRQAFKGFNILQILGRRLNSMSMDFRFILGLIFPFAVFFFILPIIMIESSKEINGSIPIWIGIIPSSFVTFLILNKDFYKAKSIAKRHFGYQVIDLKTNRPANEIRCVIRNSTIIIWPLEVIALMFNSKRRIGDLIAGTKLIEAETEDPELIMNDISEKSYVKNKSKLIWISILISLLISALAILPELLAMI